MNEYVYEQSARNRHQSPISILLTAPDFVGAHRSLKKNDTDGDASGLSSWVTKPTKETRNANTRVAASYLFAVRE